MEPQIVFEDSDLLVINKPAGITVNKSETTVHEVTVQEWAEERLQFGTIERMPVDDHNDFYNRGGIVHRLDKETSGILLIAKTPDAFLTLQSQFKERTVEKTYIALVHGILSPAAGEINIPVGRLPWNRKQFGIIPGGRESVTFYKTLAQYKDTIGKDTLTLLELSPKTGRTHQIRVHLKYTNHPIFADYLYAGRKTARNDRKRLQRVFLHAAAIIFSHPVSGERLHFTAPLPDELESFLSQLQKLES